MGKTTFSLIDFMKANTSEFHELGVLPTSPATVPTFSLISKSIAERLSLITSIMIFLKNSSIFPNKSNILIKYSGK